MMVSNPWWIIDAFGALKALCARGSMKRNEYCTRKVVKANPTKPLHQPARRPPSLGQKKNRADMAAIMAVAALINERCVMTNSANGCAADDQNFVENMNQIVAITYGVMSSATITQSMRLTKDQLRDGILAGTL